MKTVLRGKYIALHAYIRKKESPKVDHLTFCFRKLKEKITCKVSRRNVEQKSMKLRTGNQ